MNLEKLCSEVILLSKEVGSFIKSQKLSADSIEVKSQNSLVTFVDKTAELMLVKRLAELLPEAGFIAEEGTSDKRGEVYNWLVDPLDGTTNFIHSLPCFSVSIALQENRKTILGVVYEINQDECFYAIKDGKAFLNTNEIYVSETLKMEAGLIATGFPYHDFEKEQKYLRLLSECMHTTRGVRRLGSAAVDLAYVACGRFDAFFEYALQPWDVAAGAFIVEQAGGIVVDFNGGDDFVFGGELIAVNHHMSAEFISVVQKYL